MDADNNRKRKAEDDLNEESKRARVQYERYYTPEEEEERKQVAGSVQLITTILNYHVDLMAPILPFLSLSELLKVRISNRATSDTISEFINKPSLQHNMETDRADMALLVRDWSISVQTIRNPGYTFHVPIGVDDYQYIPIKRGPTYNLIEKRIWNVSLDHPMLFNIDLNRFTRVERVVLSYIHWNMNNIILPSTVWDLSLQHIDSYNWNTFLTLTQHVTNRLLLLQIDVWPIRWNVNDLLNTFPNLSVLKIERQALGLRQHHHDTTEPTDRRIEALLVPQSSNTGMNIKARIVIVEPSFVFSYTRLFHEFLSDSYYPGKEIVCVNSSEWTLVRSLELIIQQQPTIVNSETLKIIQVHIKDSREYFSLSPIAKRAWIALKIPEIKTYIFQLARMELFPKLTTLEICYNDRNDLDIEEDIVFNNRIRLIITNKANKDRLTFKPDSVLDAILRNAAEH